MSDYTRLAADYITLTADRDALAARVRELEEALERIARFIGPTLPEYENAVNVIKDIQYYARAALAKGETP